jgi:hypothetical protein
MPPAKSAASKSEIHEPRAFFTGAGGRLGNSGIPVGE